jgi:two-component system NtrC family sensor kinase
MTPSADNPAPPTVLVVDDHEAGRYVTCHILRREGYRILEAATGQEAMDRAAELPDVIVLDVKLPDFSGFEVCRLLRSDPATATIPVLHLSSSFLDEGSVITGLEGGADGYLTLPVEPPVLVAYVRALLRVGQVLRRLQQSEARFRGLFEGVADGLLLADPVAQRFRMANPAMCELLGYREDELSQLWITDIHPPEALATAQDKFARVLGGTVVLVPNLATRRKDGRIIHVDISTTLLVIDGRTMVLGSFRDVTERRGIEQRLAQSDRLASMGLLAAGVAHELNNPLAYAMYNLDALCGELRSAREANLPVSGDRLEPLLEKAEATREGAQRMRAIVQDLHTFSRLERRDDRPLQLGPMIEAVSSMAAHEIRFRARLQLALGPTPLVRGNEGRLSQAFLNLLVHAARSIEEGYPERNRITVRSGSEEGMARIVIEDTGRGYTTEQLHRLFDPFNDAEQVGEGAGLGLAICHRIVEEHQGRIEVHSEPGRGSRVTVLLPGVEAARPRPAQSEPPAAPGPAPDTTVHTPRVLLIDDEPQLLRAMRRLLSRADIQVEIAPSGQDAQRLLATDRDFDVVLCDLMMPDILGMDLHAWLTEQDAALARRVVFLTGGTYTPRAQEYLDEVGNPVLSKPLPRDQLVAAIQDVIQRYGPRSTA